MKFGFYTPNGDNIIKSNTSDDYHYYNENLNIFSHYGEIPVLVKNKIIDLIDCVIFNTKNTPNQSFTQYTDFEINIPDSWFLIIFYQYEIHLSKNKLYSSFPFDDLKLTEKFKKDIVDILENTQCVPLPNEWVEKIRSDPKNNRFLLKYLINRKL